MIAWISRVFSVSEDRASSFAYAAPWTVFIIIGQVAVASSAPHSVRSWLFVASQCVFLIGYMAQWLLHDPAPRSRRMRPRALVSPLALAVVAVCSIVLVPSAGIFNAAFFACLVLLLTPRSLLWPAFGGVTAVVALACIPVAIAEPGLLIPVTISYVGTSLFLVMVRRSLEEGIEQTLALTREAYDAAQAERDRMASDLHDVLGQSLTAMSTLSQLSARLIDAGRLDEARGASMQVAELSREALAQMRAVVHSRQQRRVDEELASAQLLTDSAGIAVSVEGEVPRFTSEVETLVAHTIRESVANVVHHSRATSCRIRFASDGVTVTNDGVDQSGAESARGGRGLANLRARAQGLGRIDAGRVGGEWRVQLKLDPKVGGAGDSSGGGR
ncbi:hypothetical protein H8R18_00440 [Nanchangia anserum]|uniref:Signal transduction histidine kinase subgroup 3 dimerisation and phosphoacceptor domain-containing protein n=1 Tax=Nanchangia anserum TaxID=2692125 RepID=A0A8I0G893_9ACTO|nr:histidine kinase [Nanchangia anserum]MBD3689715.1 hypothetical protein [Nanchangia anserum]QOX81888.1 hypothetical protein H8R18_00440 [Nanchangia anserum]